MGTGKTLAAQEGIERSMVDWWFWIGPKTSLPNIKREFRIWGFPFNRFNVEFFTYEGLTRWVDEWKPGQQFPAGMVCDESSRCKNASSRRYPVVSGCGHDRRESSGWSHGFVLGMSGTPSPKSPVDWWSRCKMHGPASCGKASAKAMEERLAFLVAHDFGDGVPVRETRRFEGGEKKCAVCGMLS